MNLLARSVRTTAAALAAGALTACSLLGGPWGAPKPPPAPPPAPVQAPVEAPPVATYKFEIGPDHDDVVGVLQATRATTDGSSNGASPPGPGIVAFAQIPQPPTMSAPCQHRRAGLSLGRRGDT